MGFIKGKDGQVYLEYCAIEKEGGLFAKLIWLFIFSIIFFGALGSDYENAKFEEKVYCQNVEDGVWPDYKNIYNDVCKDIDKKE